MAKCELDEYRWGVLNPFFKKKITEFIDYENISPITVALKAAKDSQRSDFRIGASEIRGIVLRVENSAGGGGFKPPSSGHSPAVRSADNQRPDQPAHLPAYKILVPELDAALPWPCSITDPSPMDNRRIDNFKTYIGKTDQTETISVGEIAIVSFYGENFEGPIFVGPAYQKVTINGQIVRISPKGVHEKSKGTINPYHTGEAKDPRGNKRHQTEMVKNIKNQERLPIPKTITEDDPFSRDTIIKIMDEVGMTCKKERAMFLAQTDWESGYYKSRVELPGGKGGTPAGAAYEERCDGRYGLGNCDPGDGIKYPGRGFNQLTGKGGYKKYSEIAEVDLVKNPELLERTDIAAKVAIAYWNDRVDRAAACNGDVPTSTYGINGGYTHLDERIKIFNQYMDGSRPGATPTTGSV